MAESLNVAAGDKAARYALLQPQLAALLAGEPNLTARLANAAAALKQTFDWLWVGFYLVDGDELVLGPFQGPVACFRIAHGRGVCGSTWARAETLVVPDVDAFPGHIACSSASRSEIVVPLRDSHGDVIGVLDVDSEHLNEFDDIDARALEAIAALVVHGEAA
ncbi:GAF domain-containing protein [Jeongeupia naejangsanensis]|uniref:GAF domain-containing protein n=1 Tax=Jeongeupia naejangsanensis TaxID=613195 RepID=A0ABS2BM55_9NEIS|nr:GAF domain-containing protein [Jeongeupia naejangsanensis]MBM3116694.1 GAF domain-containing protein [Jeongeupia naejangsanensis]